MPFTPFHLGPGLLIAMLFFPYIDVVVVLVASIIIDLEPAYYLYTEGYAYHGFFHSFLGCSIMAIILSMVAYPLRKTYLQILSKFGLKQETSFKKILVSALIGTNFHVLLDAFLYPEMQPFLPFQGNIFLNVLGWWAVYELCLWMFLIGSIIYILRILKPKKVEL